MIPRVRPPFSLGELLKVTFSTSRNPIDRFERGFAEKYGFPHGLFFPFGRSALYSLLRAMSWRDEEVVVPAYTCAVVTHAVVCSGNRVAFADNEPDHFNVSARGLSDALSDTTKMVIPIPLFGFPVDRKGYEESIAQKAPGAFVLYDVAQSFGVEDESGLQTSAADGAFFGFSMGKMLSSIEGGMLLLRDESLYKEVADYRRSVFTPPGLLVGVKMFMVGLATYCALREPFLSIVDLVERNSRLLDYYGGEIPVEEGPFMPERVHEIPTNLQARMGLFQLGLHDRIIEHRRQIASIYDARLKDAGFTLYSSHFLPTYTQYPIHVRDGRRVQSAMRKFRVQVKIPYPYTCSELPGYEEHHGRYPNSVDIVNRIVTLPIWYGIDPSTVDRVSDALIWCREEEPDLFE